MDAEESAQITPMDLIGWLILRRMFLTRHGSAWPSVICSVDSRYSALARCKVCYMTYRAIPMTKNKLLTTT